jgi:hypothetical protein
MRYGLYLQLKVAISFSKCSRYCAISHLFWREGNVLCAADLRVCAEGYSRIDIVNTLTLGTAHMLQVLIITRAYLTWHRHSSSSI